MRPDPRKATFGADYWRRPHPDVTPIEARIYLTRRRWRAFSRRMGKAMQPLMVAFGEAIRSIVAAVESMSRALAAGQGDPDEPDWPDAQRVRPEDYTDPDLTLARIDTALQHHGADDDG